MITNEEYQQIVKEAVDKHGKLAIATYMHVSIPCVERWIKGKNLPIKAIRPFVKRVLGEYKDED